MGWRDHISKGTEALVMPWTGGKALVHGPRSWRVRNPPRRHGWYSFTIRGREAEAGAPADPDTSVLSGTVRGYLVGDRLVPDSSTATGDPMDVAVSCEPVMLLEDGIGRFVRVAAGRTGEGEPLIYSGPDFPAGPEDAVLRAFQDRRPDLSHIPGVTPALEAAFRFEVWARAEAERRRAEAERLAAEEAARAEAEERARELFRRAGTAEGRRSAAGQDFDAAARAALAFGGAELLDSSRGPQANTMSVWFLYSGRRFNCICDSRTLRIVDAGICLTDHHTRERGDDYFTLESLPSVIAQAMAEGKLVVLRGDDGDDYDDY